MFKKYFERNKQFCLGLLLSSSLTRERFRWCCCCCRDDEKYGWRHRLGFTFVRLFFSRLGIALRCFGFAGLEAVVLRRDWQNFLSQIPLVTWDKGHGGQAYQTYVPWTPQSYLGALIICNALVAPAEVESPLRTKTVPWSKYHLRLIEIVARIINRLFSTRNCFIKSSGSYNSLKKLD